jgi:hypothetical protein
VNMFNFPSSFITTPVDVYMKMCLTDDSVIFRDAYTFLVGLIFKDLHFFSYIRKKDSEDFRSGAALKHCLAWVSRSRAIDELYLRIF